MPNSLDASAEQVRLNLIAFRKALGLSQPLLAFESDVSLDALRRYESGKSPVDLGDLKRFADAFRCAIGDFYEKTPRPPARRDVSPIYYVKVRPGSRYTPEIHERLVRQIQEANEAELKTHRPASPPTGGGARGRREKAKKPSK